MLLSHVCADICVSGWWLTAVVAWGTFACHLKRSRRGVRPRCGPYNRSAVGPRQTGEFCGPRNFIISSIISPSYSYRRIMSEVLECLFGERRITSSVLKFFRFFTFFSKLFLIGWLALDLSCLFYQQVEVSILKIRWFSTNTFFFPPIKTMVISFIQIPSTKRKLKF